MFSEEMESKSLGEGWKIRRSGGRVARKHKAPIMTMAPTVLLFASSSPLREGIPVVMTYRKKLHKNRQLFLKLAKNGKNRVAFFGRCFSGNSVSGDQTLFVGAKVERPATVANRGRVQEFGDKLPFFVIVFFLVSARARN